MIGYTRKLSAAEELEQLRPQVYDAELSNVQAVAAFINMPKITFSSED